MPQYRYNIDYIFYFQSGNLDSQKMFCRDICSLTGFAIEDFDETYLNLIKRYGVVTVNIRDCRIFNEIYHTLTKVAIKNKDLVRCHSH